MSTYCHDRGEDHDFDRITGRMNAARHCTRCQAISLDWDCAYCGLDMDCDESEHCGERNGEPCSGVRT